MRRKASGGRSTLRDRVGILFGTIFVIAAARLVVQEWLAGTAWPLILVDSRFWLVALVGLVFFAGLQWPRLRVVEPYIFLVIAILPFLDTPESIYGFGMYAVGVILLSVDGQLSHRPRIKLTLLGAFLVVMVFASTLFTGSHVETAVAMLLFMTAFSLFLFFTFQDKIIVFVKAAKPVVSLSKSGLSEKEAQHLLGLLAGQTMKEIAYNHHVKESTVRNSLSRAYRKLGFTDMVQVIQWAESRNVKA